MQSVCRMLEYMSYAKCAVCECMEWCMRYSVCRMLEYMSYAEYMP